MAMHDKSEQTKQTWKVAHWMLKPSTSAQH
jgi:hypothetical protein